MPLLDMGTGSGEHLSRLSSRSPLTVATEAWLTNVAGAGRLRPPGIRSFRMRSPGDGALRPLGRVLDLGCGRGQYTLRAGADGWEVVGIDYVPTAIEAAASAGAWTSSATSSATRRGCAHGRFRNLK